MNAKDKLILTTLQNRKEAIDTNLKQLIYINECNSLSRMITTRMRSNKALKRYIDSKEQDKTSYRYAELWNEAYKKYEDIENQKDIMGYASRRVRLESELSDINSDLYYRSKG